jgi:nickel transport protein
VRKVIFVASMILFACLGFPRGAWAHSVETDYLVSARSQLQIQAKFSTGEPFQEAPIKIYSPTNPDQPWAEGSTDAAGRFAFKPDPSIPGEWTVKIGQSDHGDILTVPVNQQGIDDQQISDAVLQRPHIHWDQQWTVLGIAALSGWGVRRFLRRQLY